MKKNKDSGAQGLLLQSRRDMIRNTAALTAVLSTGLFGAGVGEVIATATGHRNDQTQDRGMCSHRGSGSG